MAMRMSGMLSGMDTESIVQDLVKVRRTKVDKKKKAQTKLNWKQDAWKDLNNKLKNLQNKYLSNMRFTTAYTKKTTKVSNSNAVSVITGDGAVNGVQSMEVGKLAKTAYLTGGKIQADGDITALSKMNSLGSEFDEKFEGSFTVKAGTTEVKVDVTKDTTISDVLNKVKEAGLNASYDANQKRFFISAKESGESSNFSITADNVNGGKALSTLGLEFDASKNDVGRSDDETKAHFTKGQDAEIFLNGAKFTNKTNVFEINGLTITALAETKEGESVTLSTEQDNEGIYDLVKNFIKEYSQIVNEMDKLFNTPAAKGYEPLTAEEKEALSDTEVEEYEKKIKDALFSRDENLGTVNSSLQAVMASGIEIKGKTMFLADFGIDMLSYFEAADNEKHAYHIDGDPDDASTSGKEDKLRAMISNDPSATISFFTKLSQNLYDKMSELSKSKDGYRSFGNFYDDKKMDSDYKDYTSKIKEMEDKVNDYEDKWYKKFSKMETALAKMQSNVTAVAGLFGGGGQ